MTWLWQTLSWCPREHPRDIYDWAYRESSLPAEHDERLLWTIMIMGRVSSRPLTHQNRNKLMKTDNMIKGTLRLKF